ncbi:hypothetical protein PsorP6_014432 [Peronosclerospora sorghi]|uniref:Uncharacterized protein n=1 Tax=Peronosclerospora sorghi TaxID=230839 RepID=A0ACC0VHB5_9STRA|nr:hypothetical protein PsorP6_014432 [Peronosclerospora sorghi]
MPEKLSAPFPAKLPAPFPAEPPAPSAAELPAPFPAALSAPFTCSPFPGSALRDIMLPPPEVEYASREQLEDAVQTFARGQVTLSPLKVQLLEKKTCLPQKSTSTHPPVTIEIP